MSASFARHTGLVAVGQASVKTTQLVLAVLLVRLLSPTDWNEAAFLLSIYLAGTTIGTLNVHHSIVFFLPRVTPGQHRALVHQNMRLLALIGACIVVVLTVAAPALSGGRLGDAERIPWLAVAIAFELPTACVAMTMIATARFVAAALWDVAGTAVVLGATIVPVALGAGVSGLIGGLLVAAALRAAIGVVVVGRMLPARTSGLPTGVLLDQLRYGLPLGLTVAVAMLNRLVDKWFIAAFHSGDFGVYAIAAQEIPLLAVLPYAGGAVLVTGLVEAFRTQDPGLAHRRWIELTSSMSLVVVPIAMALVLVAPEVMVAVFTAEFAPGVVPFQLFTLVTLHRVAEYGMMLRAAGRTRDLLVVASSTLVANVVFAGVGAYAAGMTGASVGTVIASGIGWWLALRRIADALGVPFGEAFAWRTWLSAVGLSATAAVAAAVIASAATSPAARVTLKLAVFGAVVVPLLHLAGRADEPLGRRLGAPTPAVAVGADR
ncbi:MAG: lipopolysaccharide biosynthesis protein [Acidimicrobiia bacterium]